MIQKIKSALQVEDATSYRTPIESEHFPQTLEHLGFAGNAEVVHGQLTEYIVPPLCDIPAGPFYVESVARLDNRRGMLPFFQISRYPVTVAEYACFVRGGQRKPPDWQHQLSRLEYPVVSVSYYDADAYAKWLTDHSGDEWRLPSEEEWLMAACGPNSSVFPTGQAQETAFVATGDGEMDGLTPVGNYQRLTGYYGTVYQVGGHIEWTSSQTAALGDRKYHLRVLYGHSRWGFENDDDGAQVSSRSAVSQDASSSNIIFRLVCTKHTS